jgi:very-short-patch-repair endonuclease
MKKRSDGTIGGKGSRRAWRPPPAHGRGELALGKLLQDNKIRFESQVPIKTPYNDKTFICDYVLLDKAIILECDGALHFKTWRGRPAVNRMAKDEAKSNALQADGWKVLRFKDTLILREPETVLNLIREALK